jgi:hypothetical protein
MSSTVAAMNAWSPSSPSPNGDRPPSRPMPSSTNENSPTWASISPTARARPSGRRSTSSPTVVARVLTARTASTTKATIGRWVTTNPTSSSIPTETKKAALNRVWRGRISPRAWCSKWLSDTISPARNAPRETLTPARLVNQAVPKQIATVVSRNTSGEQVRATDSRTRGMTRRAPTITTRMMSPALATAHSRSRASPPCPLSMGTTSTMATMARSWKTSRLRPMRPCSALRSPRVPSTVSTIAVDDSATRNPL